MRSSFLYYFYCRIFICSFFINKKTCFVLRKRVQESDHFISFLYENQWSKKWKNQKNRGVCNICFHFSSLQFFENTSIKAIWWRILYTWQWLYYEQLIFHRIYNKIQLLFIVLLFLDQTMNIPFPSPPVLVSTSLFPFLLSSSKPIIIFFLSPSTTPSPILIGVRPFRGVKALYLWSTVKYNLLTHFEKLNT